MSGGVPAVISDNSFLDPTKTIPEDPEDAMVGASRVEGDPPKAGEDEVGAAVEVVEGPGAESEVNQPVEDTEVIIMPRAEFETMLNSHVTEVIDKAVDQELDRVAEQVLSEDQE